MEQMNMEEWSNPTQEITVADMDRLVQALKIKRQYHKEIKEKASAAYAEVEDAEKAILGALHTSGKSKYEAEGVGLVYISHKTTYSTPKTIEAKTMLFNYIKSKYGTDSLMSMASINHNTLNSWANKEIEQNPLVQLPGLDAPTAEETLNFRSK